jgi:hypothetical protein
MRSTIMTRRSATPTPQTATAHVARYGSAIFDDRAHDPYRQARPYSEPTRCDGCARVFRAAAGSGRRLASAARACRRRIHDKLPAGVLVLDGRTSPPMGMTLIAIAR